MLAHTLPGWQHAQHICMPPNDQWEAMWKAVLLQWHVHVSVLFSAEPDAVLASGLSSTYAHINERPCSPIADLKPPNLMVTEIGTWTMLYMKYEVTIVDFGLACHTPAGSSAPPSCSHA